MTLGGNFFARSRKDIRKDLQNFFDFDYESPAELNDRTQNLDKSGLGKYNFRHSANIGLGAEWKLAKRVSRSDFFF